MTDHDTERIVSATTTIAISLIALTGVCELRGDFANAGVAITSSVAFFLFGVMLLTHAVLKRESSASPFGLAMLVVSPTWWFTAQTFHAEPVTSPVLPFINYYLVVVLAWILLLLAQDRIEWA